MAQQALVQAACLVGGFDASGWCEGWQFAAEIAGVPQDNFGAVGFSREVLGIRRAAVTVNGQQDVATDGLSTYLGAQPGTAYVSTFSLPGTAAGDLAWVLKGNAKSLNPIAGGTIGELAKTDLMIQSDTVFGRGLLLSPVATKSANGNGTAVALTGPSASQRLYAALHITAVSSGTWTVKVQSDDSSGFSSALDRITFSTFTGQGWQFSSVAGDLSTETHWRATWSVSGGSSPTATIAVAVFVI